LRGEGAPRLEGEIIPPRGRNALRAAPFRPRARFYFFRAKNISPLGNAHDSKFFASRKYLSGARFASMRCFSEEKRPVAVFFSAPDHRHESVTMLSTQKVTENYQIQPLIYLTGYPAIPISCGQGSGHPHPVVVDNVLESFSNLVSLDAFCRFKTTGHTPLSPKSSVSSLR
jgi:hypothetical protein